MTAASTEEPDAVGADAPADEPVSSRDGADSGTDAREPAGELVARLRRDLGHRVPDHPSGTSGRAVLVTGLLTSWLGFLGHQFFLHPALPLRSDTTTTLAVVSGVLALAVLIRPRLHAVVLGCLVWGLVLLWTALDSALPVGLIDLAPTPSFTLYAAHLVLAVAQVPLIASAWGRLRPRA